MDPTSSDSAAFLGRQVFFFVSFLPSVRFWSLFRSLSVRIAATAVGSVPCLPWVFLASSCLKVAGACAQQAMQSCRTLRLFLLSFLLLSGLTSPGQGACEGRGLCGLYSSLPCQRRAAVCRNRLPPLSRRAHGEASVDQLDSRRPQWLPAAAWLLRLPVSPSLGQHLWLPPVIPVVYRLESSL